jgi:hypothetical protein
MVLTPSGRCSQSAEARRQRLAATLLGAGNHLSASPLKIHHLSSFVDIEPGQDAVVRIGSPCVGTMASTELQGREIDRRMVKLNFE